MVSVYRNYAPKQLIFKPNFGLNFFGGEYMSHYGSAADSQNPICEYEKKTLEPIDSYLKLSCYHFS